MGTRTARLDVYRTAIPMRSFEHAAASRDLAEAIVVRMELADGRIGWGETLPRPYVTGETLDSVVEDIEHTLWPQHVRAPRAPLPERVNGRIVHAAACAIELARIDATGGLSAYPELAGRGVGISARGSGVLGSTGPDRTDKQLRRMRWFGLRDFKLKLAFGDETDTANLRVVGRQLARAVAAGRCTLRADANGAWDADTAVERIAELAAYGVCVVEQPVTCPAEQLLELAPRCALPLMADESLIISDDAQTLLADPNRIGWNIRISKNGGLSRAISLARLAADNDVTFVVGCMVGESSILSAAQRRLLQLAPQPRFVEGNYGRFLLADDLTRTRCASGTAAS